MSKNKKIIAVLLAAIVLCGAAGFLVYSAFKLQKTQIYVFNGEYPAGTIVTQDMLTTLEVDKTIYDSGAKASVRNRFIVSGELDGILGDSLRINVSDGIPLIRSILSSAGGSEIENLMGKDKIAVTVAVNARTAVTNDLKSSSIVDVCMPKEDGYTVVEKMKILTVVREDGINVSAITLECDNMDEYLELAGADNVYCGLIKEDGYLQVAKNGRIVRFARGENGLLTSGSGANAATEAQE